MRLLTAGEPSKHRFFDRVTGHPSNSIICECGKIIKEEGSVLRFNPPPHKWSKHAQQ